jgi:membrane protein YdbS with pleckstrin-like domain
MNPLRIIGFLLLLCLVVGFGYLTYLNGFYWSYAAGIVFPLIVIVIQLKEDPKLWQGVAPRSTKVRRL